MELPQFQDYDAIIIPGAGGPRNGLDPMNSLPEWITRKLDLLCQVYNNECLVPILLLSAGTAHKAGELDINGRNSSESISMALYLETNGINPENMIIENTSFDTVGNAYFLRTMHTDIRNWKKLLVLVNEFHEPRLKLIFDWIFHLPNLNEHQENFAKYEIQTWVLPDSACSDSETLHSRFLKERESYLSMQQRINDLQLKNLSEFHAWLFREHNLYNTTNKKNLILRKNVLASSDAKCINSY